MDSHIRRAPRGRHGRTPDSVAGNGRTGMGGRAPEADDPRSQRQDLGVPGMHKCNSQDHSMLTAMTAAENILGEVTTLKTLVHQH